MICCNWTLLWSLQPQVCFISNYKRPCYPNSHTQVKTSHFSLSNPCGVQPFPKACPLSWLTTEVSPLLALTPEAWSFLHCVSRMFWSRWNFLMCRWIAISRTWSISKSKGKRLGGGQCLEEECSRLAGEDLYSEEWWYFKGKCLHLQKSVRAFGQGVCDLCFFHLIATVTIRCSIIRSWNKGEQNAPHKRTTVNLQLHQQSCWNHSET